ncbi:hypothetical protein [Bradyrhizobium acaciae]|uniref:hypothetical protein n=1 Tax=Bradyrhizobium acaciae TaxID=2683706 RepID=UPI001E29FC75|nr:hypothetical protein [Bradyrhizobium acaciae]MCC8982244.1 hypothetical protein [Bradyrhizobium acaciae]
MNWLALLLFVGPFVYFLLRAKRSHERSLELKPTGIYRSPLAYAWIAILLAILVLMFGSPYLPHHRWALIAYLAAWVVVLVAAFFVRRALKWRYPI